jgi:hypothetical protein
MKKLFIALLPVLFIFSCKKQDYVEPIIPSVDYKITDSMKLNSSYSTSDPSFYNNYNGKIYNNTEINITSNFAVDASGVTLQFQDKDATKGNTLAIKFIGKTLDNISGTYDLAGSSVVKFTQSQNFNGGTFSQNVLQAFLSGSLTINYSLSNDFMYGSITNAKHYIGVYVPYQTASAGVAQTLSHTSLLLANQSSRTYNIIFSFIKRG